MAETTIGLFKTEAIGRVARFGRGRCAPSTNVEYPTMEWVDWYNNRRMHSVLDYIPPSEYESTYYAQLRASQPAMSQT